MYEEYEKKNKIKKIVKNQKTLLNTGTNKIGNKTITHDFTLQERRVQSHNNINAT